ncbi:hypothetical protein [Henriciella marina]|uniref:hypothetical protein n=1 Tax=Henriciella marina TaxID=453851 RepID=UPI000366C860|nr:hypothetical protein [Henriciella marina]
MKYLALVAISALALSGCDRTAEDREAIMEFCQEEVGMEVSECTCLVDAAEKTLDDELFGKFAAVARNDGDRTERMEELSSAEQRQLYGFIEESAVSCALQQE